MPNHAYGDADGRRVRAITSRGRNAQMSFSVILIALSAQGAAHRSPPLCFNTIIDSRSAGAEGCDADYDRDLVKGIVGGETFGMVVYTRYLYRGGHCSGLLRARVRLVADGHEMAED